MANQLSELIEFTRWTNSLGKHATHVVVPRAVFLQLVKERNARRRCAAVLKKTHKEMKRQLRFNSWGKDRSGRWGNENGSMVLDDERRKFLKVLHERQGQNSR